MSTNEKDGSPPRLRVKIEGRGAELAGLPNMPLEATAGKGPFRSSRRAFTRRASAAGR